MIIYISDLELSNLERSGKAEVFNTAESADGVVRRPYLSPADMQVALSENLKTLMIKPIVTKLSGLIEDNARFNRAMAHGVEHGTLASGEVVKDLRDLADLMDKWVADMRSGL